MIRNPMTLTRIAALPVLAVALAFVAACSSNQPFGEQIDDATITATVKTKLAADPEVNPFRINVDVEAGVVRLSGVVEKDTTRYEAEKLARHTRGVREVINDIQVGKKTIASRWDDTTIATKVKSKLTADPEINPFNITVEVQDGVVTLFGKVKSANHRDEAEKLALNTQGVVRVKNLLELEGMEKKKP